MAKKDGRFRKTPRVFDKSIPPKANLIGEKFGKLIVSDWAGKWIKKPGFSNRAEDRNYWICLCECGDAEHNPVVVPTRSLTHGNTSSCGCRKRKHLMSDTRVYGIWSHMVGRCTNPKDNAYSRYGGRGLTVCDLWRNSFEDFYADMGDPPTEKHSLDRVNNDLGYDPSNCRWATSKQQNRNKRNNHWIEWRGETKTFAEWSEDPRLTGKEITQGRLSGRISYGWDIEKAMTTPGMPKKLITYQGESRSMMEWSRRLGATKQNNIVSKRLRCGWTLEEALSIPLGEKPI